MADNVKRIYLSLATLKGLGVLPPDFPNVGTVPEVAAVGRTKCSNEGVAIPGEAPCSCPVRTLPHHFVAFIVSLPSLAQAVRVESSPSGIETPTRTSSTSPPTVP